MGDEKKVDAGYQKLLHTFKIITYIGFGLLAIMNVEESDLAAELIGLAVLIAAVFCVLVYNYIFKKINQNKKIKVTQVLGSICIAASVLILALSRIIVRKPGFNLLLLIVCVCIYAYPAASLQKMAEKN